ncbi:hypothetical protein UFOVP650_69 [uncultured Caudovirales phage]|uniref:Uncharacterized protein n=1 Tax=uncultured Caudovirales phage TaxID=2100421 RepID=A0A6J5N7L3_9CAUD|nr:hypothetical protein UFOVP650_69 [uncultured Caudovirales phage]
MKVWTKDDYLALWRASLPRFYTSTIEDTPGFDVPAAQAAIFARFEQAINTTQGYYLREHSIQTGPVARGAAKAQGVVQVARLAAVGALTLPASTRLPARQLGTYGESVLLGHYVTKADVVFADGFVGAQSVAVEAEFPGYSGNLEFGGQITEFAELGRALVRAVVAQHSATASLLVRDVPPSEDTQWDVFPADGAGRYVRLVQLTTALASDVRVVRRVAGIASANGTTAYWVSPPLDASDLGKVLQVEVEEWGDLGLSVTQPSPILGGVSDMLGAIGDDRRAQRVPGETDDQFSDRLQNLGDTVSPAAIERKVGSILDPLGIEWCLRETADLDTLMGFTYDIHPFDAGDLALMVKLPGSGFVGQGAVWLGPQTMRRFFIVCVERSQLGDFGFGYDYTTAATDYVNAWDQAGWDGRPLVFQAVLARVWQEVNQTRAGGVGFLLKLDCC